MEQQLKGLRVLAFESRRALEMAELIRRHGGEPTLAPALREVPLSANAAVGDYLARLQAGSIDIVILLTGVGLRTLVELAAPTHSREQIAALLARVIVVARGPKPVAALRELGLTAQLIVPEPNTWREILATFDETLPVAGQRVAVQEYGISNPELLDGLRQRGAEVLSVPIYRWALPEDVGPLQQAVEALADARVDLAVFTSATQVHHLFEVAGARAAALRAGCQRVVLASIGPICSEALTANGLSAEIEPAHGKMGLLVAEVARRGPALVAAKR